VNEQGFMGVLPNMVRAPMKKDALEKLKQLCVPIGDILDVGVLANTMELIPSIRDHKHFFKAYPFWSGGTIC